MTEKQLGRMAPVRLSGSEPFTEKGVPLAFQVTEFWRWSTSDLVSNSTRGVLAEYIVAKALGIRMDCPREEWGRCDLETPEGLNVEVKSAAFLQTWAQVALSKVTFVVSKRRGWDPDTNVVEAEPKRHANVYVFALLAHENKATVDPLNLDQWQFWAISTRVLDARARSQHSITLPSLRALAGSAVAFSGLREAVSRAGVEPTGHSAHNRMRPDVHADALGSSQVNAVLAGPLVTLESQLSEAFVSFTAAAAAIPPYARERELVSMFVFAHLLPTLRPGAAVTTASQIGIEVAVPQRRDRPNRRRDPDVCKDVVIWPKPLMVCWDAEGGVKNYPLAVLEWKSINRQDRSSTSRAKRHRDHPDLDWLRWLVGAAPSPAEGYAVLLDLSSPRPLCSVHRVTATDENARWFVEPVSSLTIG